MLELFVLAFSESIDLVFKELLLMNESFLINYQCYYLDEVIACQAIHVENFMAHAKEWGKMMLQNIQTQMHSPQCHHRVGNGMTLS